MENTKALIRELLTIINRNVGGIPENVQELYYKAHDEIEKVENIKLMTGSEHVMIHKGME